jgi:FMN-dependent NADH-azoreductase
VPANLKAWIDQIVRVGRTFAMPGFQGLAGGRQVYVIVASGSEPANGQDHLTPFLRQVFAMIGIGEVAFIPVVQGRAQWPPELNVSIASAA